MNKLKRQLKSTKKNTARSAAASRNKGGIDDLLSASKARPVLQKCVSAVPDIAGEILEVRVRPLKKYLDRDSFSLTAVYDVKIKSGDSDIRDEQIFAVAHSSISKEAEYEISREIFGQTASNFASALVIPQPYCFVKHNNLLLRQYVGGDVLNSLVIKEKELLPKIYERLATAVVEFQRIKIESRVFDASEEKPNINDVKNNISILKEKNHPQWRVLNEKLKEVEDNFGEIRAFEEKEYKVLSHGDLNPTNIILTSGDKVAFLDLYNAGQRHRLWDIAAFYSHLGAVAGKEQQELFLDAYFKADGRPISGKEEGLFEIYKNYFDLLILTHFLVWG